MGAIDHRNIPGALHVCEASVLLVGTALRFYPRIKIGASPFTSHYQELSRILTAVVPERLAKERG